MRPLALAIAMATFAPIAYAQPVPLKPDLAGLAFLVGTWSSGRGQVAETSGSSTGSSTIETAANGEVLLRRDHTNLFDKSGKPAGQFDQIMMIYLENGTLHADYSDGAHVIHYTSAIVVPGKSVAFSSIARPGSPTFRLVYTFFAPATLTVSFSMAPPGRSDFQPIATGTLKKSS